MKRMMIVAGACVLVIVLSAFVSFSRVSSVEHQVDVNKGKISSLQNQVDVSRISQTRDMQDIVLSETGYDADRVELDKAVAEEFMSKVFSWSTNAQYVRIREDLMEEYGLDEKGTFMTVFMPEPYVNVSRDGTEYPQIDLLGLNANYDYMDVLVRNIANGTYSYFARVKWHAKADDGTVASTESVFLFDTNDDHELLNLEAYNIQ